jgi:hypothetical protein
MHTDFFVSLEVPGLFIVGNCPPSSGAKTGTNPGELSRSARSGLPPGTQALPHRIQEGGEVSSRDVLPLGFPSVRSTKQTRVLLYRVKSLRISLPHPRPREAARRS